MALIHLKLIFVQCERQAENEQDQTWDRLLNGIFIKKGYSHEKRITRSAPWESQFQMPPSPGSWSCPSTYLWPPKGQRYRYPGSLPTVGIWFLFTVVISFPQNHRWAVFPLSNVYFLYLCQKPYWLEHTGLYLGLSSTALICGSVLMTAPRCLCHWLL